jgi:hypothetical protein
VQGRLQVPDLAPIRIFYGGVELVGDVVIRTVNPEVKKAGP